MLYGSGFQPVVRGPPVVLEGIPDGPQRNDGEWGSFYAHKSLAL